MPLPVMIDDSVAGGGGGVQGSGSLASRLLANGFNISAFRTNDVLRKDEWKLFDDKVIQIARERLVGLGDLLNRGLRFPIANALGTTQIEWEVTSDMTPAEISMSGVTPAQRDRVTYTLKNLPLPIVHKDFSINIRALEASRRLGQTLDTTMAAVAARRVADLNEDILFNGATITVSGTSIQGLTTATNRNTGSLTGDWALVAQDGEEIVRDIIAMMAASKAKFHYGPWLLYVPTAFGNKLNDDYKSNSDKTIRQRILELEGITGIMESGRLSDGASGEVVLLELSSDVIDILDGMQPTTIQWSEQGGMVTMFKVMSILVPRIKIDSLNQSGITHYSV